MIDHLGLQVDDLAACRAWYDEMLGVLGAAPLLAFDVAVGYGPQGGEPSFWIGQATDPAGRQAHVAFRALDRDAVHAFREAAIRLGSEVLHEPREWPEYHPGYYAVFVRDPAGNNVEAVCHVSN
jgi:catechol 2,3-dioxygenase-like lactoylglutathione lyase family enzyme